MRIQWKWTRAGDLYPWIVNVERTSNCSKSITTYTYVEVEIIFTEPDLCDLLTFSLCSFREVVYKSMAREGHGVFIMSGLDNVNMRGGPQLTAWLLHTQGKKSYLHIDGLLQSGTKSIYFYS